MALITGASYGIGMAIAKAMAANGATIVFNDIKQELVDKGLASYAEAGIKAHSYQEYGSSAKFCLESENRVPAEYSNGTFIMRVAYHNQTAVFRYDGKTITPSKE